MKTVAGSVIDSDPVSLSKAAKILSKFTSADNGASPAFLHYLMRASDAFNELVQLHKELSGSGSERRSKKRRSGNQVEEPVNSVGNYGEATKAGAADGERLELEKVNAVVKKEGESTIGNSVDSKRKKKEKKKIKKELSEDGRSNGGHGISNGLEEEEIEGKKNKKGKNGSEVEAEGRDGEIDKKLSKKRKSGVIGVDGEGTDSANKGMQSKKRKKVKSELDN